MAASQTELPYCSDKGTGRRGAAQEVDTPAPAAGATAATVARSRQREGRLDSNESSHSSSDQKASQDSVRASGGLQHRRRAGDDR